MGKGIQNYPNILAADADYLSGSIKDNPGDGSGTHFSKLEYQDIHQTFAKVLRDSNTTPNNLYDNESNGYQYFTAIRDLFGQHRKITFKDGVAVSTLINTDYYPLVIVKATAATGHVVSMQTPSGTFTGRITVTNYSAFAVSLVDQAGTNNINGVAGPFSLAAGLAITLKYGAGNWTVDNYYHL